MSKMIKLDAERLARQWERHDGQMLVLVGQQVVAIGQPREGGGVGGVEGEGVLVELLGALDRLKARTEQIKSRAVAGARATDRLIRDNPYRSLGVVFGAGLVLGMLINRRR